MNGSTFHADNVSANWRQFSVDQQSVKQTSTYTTAWGTENTSIFAQQTLWMRPIGSCILRHIHIALPQQKIVKNPHEPINEIEKHQFLFGCFAPP